MSPRDRCLVGAASLGALCWLGGWGGGLEHTRTVALQCTPTTCRFETGAGAPLEIARTRRGDELGVYFFRPYHDRPGLLDRRAHPQTLRQITLREDGLTPQVFQADRAAFSLAPLDEASASGELLVVGDGLRFSGRPGQRGLFIFDRFRSADRFRIEARVEHGEDLGFVFDAVRAPDSDAPAVATVAAVRQVENDRFFFTWDGVAGPPLDFDQLEPLVAVTEFRALSALLGGWLFWAALIALILQRASSGRPAPVFSEPHWRLSTTSTRWLVCGLALVAVGVSLVLSVYGLGRTPHTQDEGAYLFQARLFAVGLDRAPIPSPFEFFRYEHLVVHDRSWFSKYPPGWSALLAPFVLVGMPELANALLVGAFVWLCFALGRVLGGDRLGVLSAMLATSSPFVLILSGSLLSHLAAMVFCTGFLLFAVRAKSAPVMLPYAGVCIALAFCVRPFSAVLFGGLVGVWLLWTYLRAEDAMPLKHIAIAVGLAAVGPAGLALWVQHYGVEEAGLFDLYSAYFPNDVFGFGPDKGRGWIDVWGSPGHTLAKGLRSARTLLEYTASHLLGAPLAGSFVLVILGALVASSEVWLLSALVVGVVAAHIPYWAAYHINYGARYHAEALAPLLVLAALGLSQLLAFARGHRARTLGVSVLLGIWFTYAAFAYWPARYRELWHFGDVRPELRQWVEANGVKDALFFVETDVLWYNDGWHLNPIDFESGNLFLRDLGPEKNATALRRWPQRDIYRWDKRRMRVSKDVTEGDAK